MYGFLVDFPLLLSVWAGSAFSMNFVIFTICNNGGYMVLLVLGLPCRRVARSLASYVASNVCCASGCI